MDLIQVRIALAVARNKSFSAAGKELAYSQSTVSKRVGALEEELGVRLFERKTRARVELTAEGEQLLADLQAFERDAVLVLRHAADLRERAVNRLRIGCLSGWSTFGEDEIIIGFNEHRGCSSIDQEVGSLPYLVELLDTRRLDGLFLAIVESREHINCNGKLSAMDVWDLRLKIACSTSHPAASKEVASLTDFKDDTFLFRKTRRDRDDDTKLRCFIEACDGEHFTPEIEYADLRSSMAFSMVAAGICVAPLMFKPRSLRQDIALMPLDKDYYHFSVKFVYRSDNDSELLADFLDYLESYRRAFGKAVRDE